METFSRQAKDTLIPLIQQYLADELDVTLGNFDTEFLLDFFSEQVGPLIYNQALRDVQTHLAGYLDTLNERVDELEKTLPKPIQR